ncbi:uncharacterized protein LOC142330585 isoform X2 [Lycorma delicatula]|uniref:uncharacterized protein LOC142330585 isoform X2 n=1 Tax=Lycorma delicatula TaxID=130591 RepID=UPI003F50D774
MPRESIRHQDKPVKRTSSPQQMTRQTLQALSAAPRSRFISTDTWIQTKRKPKQENYNYQHWLIQVHHPLSIKSILVKRLNFIQVLLGDVLNMNMFGIPLIGADICGFQKMLQLHFVRDGINLVHFIPSHVLIILMIVLHRIQHH